MRERALTEHPNFNIIKKKISLCNLQNSYNFRYLYSFIYINHQLSVLTVRITDILFRGKNTLSTNLKIMFYNKRNCDVINQLSCNVNNKLIASQKTLPSYCC